MPQVSKSICSLTLKKHKNVKNAITRPGPEQHFNNISWHTLAKSHTSVVYVTSHQGKRLHLQFIFAFTAEKNHSVVQIATIQQPQSTQLIITFSAFTMKKSPTSAHNAIIPHQRSKHLENTALNIPLKNHMSAHIVTSQLKQSSTLKYIFVLTLEKSRTSAHNAISQLWLGHHYTTTS